MSVFDTANDALYTDPNLGVSAVYSPLSGGSFPVTAIWRHPDDTIGLAGMNTRLAQLSVSVRVTEIAAPRTNDGLTIAGTGYRIANPLKDDDGINWHLDLKAG